MENQQANKKKERLAAVGSFLISSFLALIFALVYMSILYVSVIFLLLGLFLIIASYGILKLKKWGLYLGFALAILLTVSPAIILGLLALIGLVISRKEFK